MIYQATSVDGQKVQGVPLFRPWRDDFALAEYHFTDGLIEHEVEQDTIQLVIDDSWAMIDLYRWQYGHLPEDHLPVDVPTGLRAMAKALERDNPPARMNVKIMLEALAKAVSCESSTSGG